jgi:hypothetical protein
MFLDVSCGMLLWNASFIFYFGKGFIRGVVSRYYILSTVPTCRLIVTWRAYIFVVIFAPFPSHIWTEASAGVCSFAELHDIYASFSSSRRLRVGTMAVGRISGFSDPLAKGLAIASLPRTALSVRVFFESRRKTANNVVDSKRNHV